MKFFDHTCIHDVTNAPKGMSAWDVSNELFSRWMQNPGNPKDEGSVELARQQLITEARWITAGRPYYKVYPNLVDMLLQTSLDIPSKYLSFPFNEFVIRFSEGDPHVTLSNGMQIRTIMPCIPDNAVWTKGNEQGDTNILLVWVDLGEEIEPGFPFYYFCKLPFGGKGTIDQGITRSASWGDFHIEDGVNLSPYVEEINTKVFKILTSICFLATGEDRVVEPDVLSKDLANYIEAHRKRDEPRKRTIEQRAARRGKKGWTVGRDLPVYSPGGSTEKGESTGRELQYSHIRKPHFHAVRYGPEHSRVKVVWFRQTRVRPDLPPPPSQRRKGYEAK